MEARSAQSEDFSFGNTVVVPRRRELLRNGLKVEIGDRAFDLLLVLVKGRGSILSKDRIMELVWGDRIVEENALEGQISTLRRALGEDRSAVHTVIGRGYQFIGELTESLLIKSGPTLTALLSPIFPGVRLPASISPIIGREKELRGVSELVSRHRLVTLVGSGGIGKTRLAAEVARQIASHFADGVYLAELAATTSADYLPATLAVALGFSPGDGTPSLDRLSPCLSGRHLLLLLDNCEHLIDSAAQIAEALLHTAPFATIIATSREPLRLPGEFVYRVPSLEVPFDDDADAGREFGAIRLLEERVGAPIDSYSEPSSALQLEIRICRRLDGIPLAIELAAACVPLIGLQGVADRLHDRFHLLTRGARTALPRQRTLRATLDWSYSLLSEAQRKVLDRISLFAGTFTIESAHAVASDDGILPDSVSSVLFELIDKSLVSTVPGGGQIHYRLLETTRAYAYEKLRAGGALREYSMRYALYFLEIFQQAEQQAAGRVEIDWNVAYASHLADLRAAIEWGFSSEGYPEIAVDLTIASIPVSMQLALLEECLVRVDQALVLLEKETAPAGQRHMKLYAARGMCLLCQNVGPQTRTAFKTALELANQTANSAYQLLGMWGYWMCLYLNGEYTHTLPLAQKFDAVAMASHWSCDQLAAYRLIGMSHLFLGELDEALANLVRAAGSRATLPRTQRIRFLYDERMLSRTSLAHTLWFLGRPDQAMLAAHQSLADARELDHPVSLCYALSEALCTLALLTGDDVTLDEAVSTMMIETRRHGISTWKARAQMWQGFLELRAGSETAFDQKILPALSGIGSKRYYISLTPFLSATGLLLADRDRLGDAMALIDPAVERAIETGDECCLPELLRAKAELLLFERDQSLEPTAQAMLINALARAQKHQFLSWELRCATTLAALKQRQGLGAATHELLTTIYNRFAEGFDTTDLKIARGLISHVSVPRSVVVQVVNKE